VTSLIALCSKSSCENTRARLTCPRSAELRLRAGFLEKTLAEIDLILQQHRKPWPDHATLSVSLRQAPGPAAPVVQNAFTLLAAAGQAAYCRKKTVQLHEVQCCYQSSTDKGQLAAALQTRLEQVGAGSLSHDKDTLRRLVFTKGMQQCKALSDFLSTHVRSGLYVW
jgi:hypothetical protein